jgi:hypothetical protein
VTTEDYVTFLLCCRWFAIFPFARRRAREGANMKDIKEVIK